MESRRKFLKSLGLLTAGSAMAPSVKLFAERKSWFDISLAQWSLHRTLFSGELKNIDFTEFAAKKFKIYSVGYVSQFFKEHSQNMTYLKDLNYRAKDNGVKNLVLTVVGEDDLGGTDSLKRKSAVESHYKWIDAASFLGCSSVRVNASGNGSGHEVAQCAIESLNVLARYASKSGINVIVENAGGFTSDGTWLAGVLKSVGKDNCGSLPDFGNFNGHDPYQGIKELMPYAKFIHAKTLNFDSNGNEGDIDYDRMMQIVKDGGYTGYIGVEYEGNGLSEVAGILATKKLLERYRTL